MTAESLATRSLDAIEKDRRVPMAYGVSRDAYLSVRGETDALAWQLAEMPAHQLHYTAEYLAGLLAREPLRSKPTLEPPRLVLGLLLLALEHVVGRIGNDDEASLATLRPPAYVAAGRALAAIEAEVLEQVDRDAPPSQSDIDAFFAPSPEEPMPRATAAPEPDDAPPA